MLEELKLFKENIKFKNDIMFIKNYNGWNIATKSEINAYRAFVEDYNNN